MAGVAALTGAAIYASVQSPDAELAWNVARRVPLNTMSRAAGHVATWRIPMPFRRPIYHAYAAVYGVDLNECERPYVEYATLQEFFSRRLVAGARPIAANGLASPVDGTVLHFGLVGPDHSLEQVKGSPFTLESFIGPHELALTQPATPSDTPNQLYYCTIYLAPGDYHGVHAPVPMTVDGRRHFPGLLLPVSPVVVSVLQGLFSLNERIVLFGRWRHGFFSLTPVGATNVGSIALKLEPHLSTNQRPKLRQPFYDRVYSDEQHDGRHVQAGDELAFFRLGSTVVMIFEAPPFRFIVEQGQKVKLGQLVGFIDVPPNITTKA
jgi:phosphatidylserine decarboxylase